MVAHVGEHPLDRRQAYQQELQDKAQEGNPFYEGLWKDAVVAFLLFGLLAGLALVLTIPMEKVADPQDVDYVPRPEWYFYFLFELLWYFQGRWMLVGTFLIPFALVLLSSMGLPGLNGFVGEFLILVGVFQNSALWAAITALVILFSAIYMLSCYQRTMFGRLEKPENAALQDLSRRELALFLPICLLIVWIGFYPFPFLKLTETSANHLPAQVTSSRVVE